MTRRFRFLLPLLLAAAAARAENQVLTLNAALDLALQHNRQVAAAALEVGQARDRLAKAKSSRLPTLKAELLESRLLTSIDFEFKEGAFGNYPGTGPIPATDTTITTEPSFTTLAIARLSQPISQLYKIELGVKARGLGVDLAAEQARETKSDIAGAVRAAYYGALRARASLTAAREAERLAHEIERLASEAVGKETALPGELMDAKARVARAGADVATLEDALRTQKELLNAYLARELETEFELADVPEALPEQPLLEAARRDARERKPSVRQARIGASLAEVDTKLARAEFIPDVSLTFSYLSPWGTELLPKNIASAGISLSWEVFDGGRRTKELAEKKKAAEEARLKAREAEELAAVAVSRDVRKLSETHRLLEAARLSRTAAAERLRVEKNRYEASATLMSELLRAQASHADATREENDALLSYWTARADYEKSHGEDL